MSQKYYKFMREFNRDEGYTSFYGSNKKDFQDAWARAKGVSIKPRSEIAEMAGMGREDNNVAKKATISGEQKKYDIIKKILMELDRKAGRNGNDTDPFGSVKDLLIIPEREGKTKKQIVDEAYDYFKTHTNINYDIRHSVLMKKLFLELQELMEVSGMGGEDINRAG